MINNISTFTIKRFPKVIFGHGAFNEIPEEIKTLGNKVLLITMNELINLGLLDPITTLFDAHGIDYKIYKNVKPEPKIEDYDEAINFVKEENFEIIIGIGGGSVIDFAKGLSIAATHEKNIWDYVNLSNKPPEKLYREKLIPVVAIPTTSGTGSEVTPYSVVINNQTQQEGTIKNDLIIPKLAIIDPTFLTSLPKDWTAITGIDAFAHALESLFNKKNRSNYSNLIALEAIKNIIEYLPFAYNNGDDLNARSKVAYGATLAGMAIAMAGTTVCHALVHPTDARFGIPHGLSVGIYTSAVLRQTLPHGIDIFNSVILNFDTEYKYSKKISDIELGLDRIDNFINQFGLKNKLSDYGVTKKDTDNILNDAMNYMYRPIKQHEVIFGKKDLKRIIEKCY